MLKQVRNLIHSVFYSNIRFGSIQNPEVVFYYPQHFNRSDNSTNPYFQPLIEACEKYKISYIIIEEPDNSNNFKQNPAAFRFDFFLYLIILIRKLLPLSWFESFESREHKIARFLKPIFFRHFQFKVFITMSNSMLGFFRGLSPGAILYDYQHGIINAAHTGYIINNTASPHIKLNNVSVLMHGKAFQNILNQADPKYYPEHTQVIGVPVKHNSQTHKVFNNNVLVTLQFTAGDYVDFQQLFYKYLADLFGSCKQFFLEHHITLYLKNHPRYGGTPDISPFYNYPFVKTVDLTNDECYTLCSVNLTYHSTTLFEAAQQGIPTYIINDALSNSIYYEEFEYPVENKISFTDFISEMMHEKKYQEYSVKVLNWNRQYYMPLDTEKFISILKDAIN